MSEEKIELNGISDTEGFLYDFYINDIYICDIHHLTERVVFLNDSMTETLRLQIARYDPPFEIADNFYKLLNKKIEKIEVKLKTGETIAVFNNYTKISTVTITRLGYNRTLGPRAIFEFDRE